MDLDDPEPQDPIASVHRCPPSLSGPPCMPSSSRSPSQDRGEEELMMSHALEELPEWRSPSRSSDWGRRSDVPSQPRSQDDQDLVDAISKRTRAHYSLADMSLDQLETFLQESDEEDYFQNVDDEEEYRKFLAAVQEKVGPEEHNKMEKGVEESESEDEDADFEVEIEEALESDVEEGVDSIDRKRKRTHGPVTRGKRRKGESVQNKVLNVGRAKAPLRPLLPYVGSVSIVERSRFIAGSASRPWIGCAKRYPSDCGFTAHQIGQLYCLVHEHVQLLLQVHAMCVLEPTMQQTAVDTRSLLMELVDKREAVLSWKLSAFPDFCFRPPYIHPSVAGNEASSTQIISSETAPLVRSRDGAISICVSFVRSSSVSSLASSIQSRSYEVVVSLSQVNNLHAGPASAISLHTSSGQTTPVIIACGSESALLSSSASSKSSLSEWVPAISGPVRSLLDVAPLALVREFMAVLDHIVQTSRQPHFPSENRAPLFAVRLQLCESPKSAREEVKFHCSSSEVKKTMAAAHVESTKKSIAVVPKDIASAMEEFNPLFNIELFPHKAPPAAAASRLLFTEVEDELLAMGLMTYNNDWKAIQERFLPSKSTHQIFVRQKNRSSSRAPHNSVKAVRKMKLSPLSADEVACIEEALKVYKYDWIKVCRYCVPYRDPATLPRQWRVAIGTQKSYKPVLSNRGKRRLQDVQKRLGFAVVPQTCSSVGNVLLKPQEAGSGGDGGLDKTQFHEGPVSNLCNYSATSHLSSDISCASDSIRSPAATSSRRREANGASQRGSPSLYSGALNTQSKPSRPVCSRLCTSATTRISLAEDDQTVQLAPGLPPLKLPATVRVLSHSDTTYLQTSSAHSCNAKTRSERSTDKSSVGCFGRTKEIDDNLSGLCK